jgi:hypothetical protein
VLRQDHPLFHSPRKIDFSLSKDIPVPAAWTHEIKEKTVRVLPLAANGNVRYRDGWCTYTYEHEQVPELEILCGGVNAKTPRASGIWRQGSILHFGFEQSPAELNETGKSLLVNSIAYAARFADDVPNVRRSPQARILGRNAIYRLIKNETRELETYLDWYFVGELREALRGKSRAELTIWFRENRGYLRADTHGKFILDEEARRFRIPPDHSGFIGLAIERLAASGVRDLLHRYAPSGPGHDATVSEWRTWYAENEPYLFFSDSGGFRWYVDQLAKKRHAPSISLRGVDRASSSP